MLASSFIILDALRRALGDPSSSLTRALHEFGEVSEQLGTCLVLRYPGFGTQIIADDRWVLDRADTIDACRHFAVVDLCNVDGLDRISVMSGARWAAQGRRSRDADLLMTALQVAQEVEVIAAGKARVRAPSASPSARYPATSEAPLRGPMLEAAQ